MFREKLAKVTGQRGFRRGRGISQTSPCVCTLGAGSSLAQRLELPLPPPRTGVTSVSLPHWAVTVTGVGGYGFAPEARPSPGLAEAVSIARTLLGLGRAPCRGLEVCTLFVF